jgi:hypothetical protein
MHLGGHHVHGTRAAYVGDRCRGHDCTAANTATSRTANRARRYGRWQPFTDAASISHHLAALRAAGIGLKRIASLADPSVSHIRQLSAPANGDAPGIRRIRRIATRILSIANANANAAPHSQEDATGPDDGSRPLTRRGNQSRTTLRAAVSFGLHSQRKSRCRLIADQPPSSPPPRTAPAAARLREVAGVARHICCPF